MSLYLLSFGVIVLSFAGMATGMLLKGKCFSNRCGNVEAENGLGFRYRDCSECPKADNLKSQISDFK